MNTSMSPGLRKGTWTEEEDFLLRKCVENYGEGQWHLVPIRSGLNRCRKSCRLRWLNYLRPHIKRGDFSPDEIDLIFRLHKLLGNRWSLIAGRIPGRTANDIKNYWNTHLQRKLADSQHKCKPSSALNDDKITENTIVRPRPLTISSASNAKNITPRCSSSKDITNSSVDKDEGKKELVTSVCHEKLTTGDQTLLAIHDDGAEWWASVLAANSNEIDEGLAAAAANCKLHDEGISSNINDTTWDDMDIWDLFN